MANTVATGTRQDDRGWTDDMPPLSVRQRELLALAAEGKSLKAICDIVKLTPRKVVEILRLTLRKVAAENPGLAGALQKDFGVNGLMATPE